MSCILSYNTFANGKEENIRMSNQELTRRVVSFLTAEKKLSENDIAALSKLEFKNEGDAIRIQGQYETKDENTISNLWPVITAAIKELTGCQEIIDNRICVQTNQKMGNHCICYTTDGAHKPEEWEYIPVRELNKTQQNRVYFFKGNYVRLSPKFSARKYFPDYPTSRSTDT